jgi:ketosteroid isomerase-like protein
MSNNNKEIDDFNKKAEMVAALIEMEHLFCKAAGKEGAVGWARFFSDSGVMLSKSGTPIKGPKTIENAIEPLFNLPELKFVWEPTSADVSDDGTLGYTYGNYERTYLDENGEMVMEKGMYMTIWKQQSNGEWRIAADVGN